MQNAHKMLKMGDNGDKKVPNPHLRGPLALDLSNLASYCRAVHLATPVQRVLETKSLALAGRCKASHDHSNSALVLGPFVSCSYLSIQHLLHIVGVKVCRLFSVTHGLGSNVP